MVIDGVCIGHPCCGIAHCKGPLRSNRDRFCLAHQTQNTICAVIDCANLVALGSKVCSVVEHQQTETMHNIQGQSRFQLKERLKRAQLAHPSDPLPLVDSTNSTTSQFINDLESVELDPVDENGEVVFELTPDGHPIPIAAAARDLPTTHRKLRVQFGRKRTHNEQLFVAPCGVIVARETFYHSEAPTAVIVRILAINFFHGYINVHRSRK